MTDQTAKTESGNIDWQKVHTRLAATQKALEQQPAFAPQTYKSILKQRARLLAESRPESSPDDRPGDVLEVVTFALAAEQYGIETRYVNEVYALKELTPVPCTPAFVLGITSVRGNIIPVFDIKQFFDLPARGLNELDKIVVVEYNQVEVGIRADSILGFREIQSTAIQSGLPTLTGLREKYLKGITSEGLIIIDIPRLLSDPGIIINEEV